MKFTCVGTFKSSILGQQAKPDWDIVIVGAGPAGMTAAMVLARSRRSVLIIDEGIPRNAKSQGIHNYLTRDGILPAEFLRISAKELQQYNIEHIKGRAVKAVRYQNGFGVEDNTGRSFTCRKLLIATGVTDNIPDIPGIKEMWGRGVFHCPYCDGWGLQGRIVGLYAKRFNGYGMALALKHLAGNVILFTDTARYLKKMQREHLHASGIKVYSSKVLELSSNEGKVTCVALLDGQSIVCDCLFTHNGIKYNNELVLQLGGRCTIGGATVINKRQECSVPGLYIAGDVAFDMQFVSVAVSEGAKAGVSIHNALLTEDNEISLNSVKEMLMAKV